MKLALVLLSVLLSIVVNPALSAEQQPVDSPQAFLVTYAPGALYYERFGHNAIWLKNPATGVDHIFNFGFFDFNQPNFLSRFLRGDTLYFSAARKPEIEFAEYRVAGRSISLQKLNLDSAQLWKLERHLIAQIQPGSRDYRYEYFRNNCSTRIRDALDLVLQDELKQSLIGQPSNYTLREQIHIAAEADPWLYLGMDLAMGPSLDRPQSQWQAAFIPAVLSTAVESVHGLVAERTVYYQGQAAVVRHQPLWYLFIVGTAIALLFVLLVRPWRQQGCNRSCRILAFTWLGLCSLVGMFLLWLWLATSHVDAAGNWNILLLNPLYLPAILYLRNKPAGMFWLAMQILVSTLLAALGGWWNNQVMFAPLMFLTPIMLVVMAFLWRARNADTAI
ncbi:MAG: DUF4105 domain-containing protein [Xanthomonadales bacterium]|nr:DUF4105 domain-containing protein [Xanthomonadales bacterium]